MSQSDQSRRKRRSPKPTSSKPNHPGGGALGSSVRGGGRSEAPGTLAPGEGASPRPTTARRGQHGQGGAKRHLTAGRERSKHGRREPKPRWMLRTRSPFRVGAASVVGASHVERNEECQDFWRATTLGNGGLLLVVADGAGSAACGGQGAELATAAITTCFLTIVNDRLPLARGTWESAARLAIEAARSAIGQAAATSERPVSAYACTGIIVFIKGAFVAAAQVGDGAVVTGNGAEYRLLTRPMNGEFANETTFITSVDALERLQTGVRQRGVTEVAVMTDGVQPIALNLRTLEPHAGFLQPFMRFVDQAPAERVTSELHAFLSSDRVRARTDDDVTLVLAVRDPGGARKTK